MTAAPEPTATIAPGRQDRRSAETRRRICAAAVACLDECGYGETSLQRVQDRAGVSRGAVMHHFATREDIIVETLTRILGGTRRGQGLAGRIGGVSVERDLMALWSDMVDRPEGRAMVEILVAARTDPALGVRIAPLLADYDAGIGRDVLRVYAATSGDDGDVIGIWTICRVFLRSLHLQRRFDPDPDAVRASLRRFAGLVAPHLRRRAP